MTTSTRCAHSCPCLWSWSACSGATSPTCRTAADPAAREGTCTCRRVREPKSDLFDYTYARVFFFFLSDPRSIGSSMYVVPKLLPACSNNCFHGDVYCCPRRCVQKLGLVMYLIHKCYGCHAPPHFPIPAFFFSSPRCSRDLSCFPRYSFRT